MGGSEAWELRLENRRGRSQYEEAWPRIWGRGYRTEKRPCKETGGRSPERGVAKEASGWQRGLAGLGLQVAQSWGSALESEDSDGGRKFIHQSVLWYPSPSL